MMILLLIQVRVALLLMILFNIFKVASKIRRGMSLEIDDLKFRLKSMKGPEKVIEELQEKITLVYTELFTKRNLKEGTLN